MKVAICTTNFKNNLCEAISKNVVNLSVGISTKYHTVLLIPGKIKSSIQLERHLQIENYGKQRSYKSKLRVLLNIIELSTFLKIRASEYALIHFHVGNLIELFFLWVFLPRMQAIKLVTVWQPYLGFFEFLSLPRLFKGFLIGVVHHYLVNTFLHLPLFCIGQKGFYKIIVSSNYQKRQLNRIVKESKVVVISNGVEHPIPFEHERVNSDNKRLLYIGHATAAKGIDVFLKALSSICKEKDIDVSIALSDFGNYDIKKMTRYYGINGKVTIKGIVNVYKEMAVHDLLILPLKTSVGTTYYPNVLLECFASGLPVIASSLEVIKEIITNGKTGILVRPGNVHDLVEAINGVLSKEEENLKDMSLLQKQEFERKYTLEKYIFNHVLLYNSLLNKNKMTSFKML
jgi:glycosyltransferase involved in cell wall biosynthesis